MNGAESTAAVSTIEELAATSADFARRLGGFASPAEALDALTAIGVQVVPGCEYAAVTRGARGQFETVAATDDVARQVDAIQYDLGTGPCVDAILDDTIFRTGDLRADGRWPVFGRRAAEVTGILSMLSFRLNIDEDDVIAGLNLYSRRADAFDATSEVIGTLLASQAALAMAGVVARQRVANLERALASNREIGVAMGILMARYSVPREEAFDMLRVTSQNTNRKLIAIAGEVADTGVLDMPTPPVPRPRHGPRPPRRG